MTHIFILLSFLLICSGYAQSSAGQQILCKGDSSGSEIKSQCDDYSSYYKMEQDAANHLRNGAWQKAVELTLRAWQLTKESKCLTNLEKTAHFNYASALGANKKYPEAGAELAILIQKLKSPSENALSDLKQSVMINQIINSIHLDQYKTAESLFKLFLDHNSEDKDKDKATQLLATFLNLYIQKNKFSEAKTFYERYEKYFAYNNSRSRHKLILALAKVAEGLGEHEKFKSLLNKIENHQAWDLTDNENLELKFLQIKSEYFSYLKNKNSDSLEIIQKNLVALLEHFENNKFNLQHPADIEAAAQLNEPIYTLLFETIISAQNHCQNECSFIAFWAMELYKRNGIQAYSSYSQSFCGINTTFQAEQVQESLTALLLELPSENHTLIYWYIGRHSAYALIVSQIETRIVRINDITLVLRNIDALNTSIQSVTIRKYLENETWLIHEKRNFQDLSYSIYTKLISPLRINHYSHWHISPDFGLQSLPFDILIDKKTAVDQSWSKFNYLIKNYSISYFTNFDQFCQKSTSNNTKKGILSIKESNQKAYLSSQSTINTKEINFLQRKFKVVKRFDDDFTDKESFWIEAEKYKILHFALHGMADSNNENVIIFENFNLTESDIGSRKLDGELVVLATCQSSFGDEMKGIHQKSLLQAFRLAGAKNVIAMKWDAEDETTAAILERFYFYLGEGWDKPYALRKAKLDFFEDASNLKSHPFFWAAGDVYADFESTGFRVADLEILKVLIFFSVPVLLLSLLLYKKKTSHIYF